MDPSHQKKDMSSIKDTLITAMDNLALNDESSRLKLKALIVAYAACIAKISVDEQGGPNVSTETNSIRDVLNTAYYQTFGATNSQFGNEIKESVNLFTQRAENNIICGGSSEIVVTESTLPCENGSDGLTKIPSKIEQTLSQGSLRLEISTEYEPKEIEIVAITDGISNRKSVSLSQTVSERLESQLPPGPRVFGGLEYPVASRGSEVSQTEPGMKCLDRNGSNNYEAIATGVESVGENQSQDSSVLNKSKEIEPEAFTKFEGSVGNQSDGSEAASALDVELDKAVILRETASEGQTSHVSSLSGMFEAPELQNSTKKSEIGISKNASYGVVPSTVVGDDGITAEGLLALGKTLLQENFVRDSSRALGDPGIGGTLSQELREFIANGTTEDAASKFNKAGTEKISVSGMMGFQESLELGFQPPPETKGIKEHRAVAATEFAAITGSSRIDGTQGLTGPMEAQRLSVPGQQGPMKKDSVIAQVPSGNFCIGASKP